MPRLFPKLIAVFFVAVVTVSACRTAEAVCPPTCGRQQQNPQMPQQYVYPSPTYQQPVPQQYAPVGQMQAAPMQNQYPQPYPVQQYYPRQPYPQSFVCQTTYTTCAVRNPGQCGCYLGDGSLDYGSTN